MTVVKCCNKQGHKETRLYFKHLPNGLVRMRIESNCNELLDAIDETEIDLDPMLELFTTVDSKLSGISSHLPHRVYPFLFAALKGLQVEAGLGEPDTYQIEVTKP